MIAGYYSKHLSAERLRRCYEIAPARVRQYMQAEIRHAAGKIRPTDRVLELGCGYGRIVEALAASARLVVGVDTAPSSLSLGRQLLSDVPNCRFLCMDAAALGFRDALFDVVLCLQNGISAFKVDSRRLMSGAVRVARPGGRVLFSSYSERFWEHRLEWFRLQAEEGLLGEIDWQATRDGIIACKDGFKATTFTPDDFRSLAAEFPVQCRVETVDDSSVFCELFV